jgi:predicted DNA-binding transcriptional regulator AlpA
MQPVPDGAPRAPSAADRLLRLPQILDLTGVGRTTWLTLVSRGEVGRPIKVGRASVWPESEIQAFIRERIKASREGAK